MPSPTGEEPTEREWLEGERYEDKFPSSEGNPYVADGPEIDVEPIEVVPASEVERLTKQRNILLDGLQEIVDAFQDGRKVSTARLQRLVEQAVALTDDEKVP